MTSRTFPGARAGAAPFLALALLAACGDDDSSTACERPSRSCDGRCVDIQTDELACGRCGNACVAGQTCVSGVCQTGAPCTGAGLMECDGACVRTVTNTMHCGACGVRCAPGELCVAGGCQRSDCPRASEVQCGGVCTDVMIDARNCGACGASCRGDQICNAGICGCPLGQSECGGSCVDTTSNPANCGLCDLRCPPTDACVDGECLTGRCDEPPFAMCGGECIDTSADPRHCGGCGEGCAFGMLCERGDCRCPFPLIECDGECVDIDGDDRNCGGCGAVCPDDALCVLGVCESTCDPGFVRCGDVCVDTTRDPGNCGTCGNTCSSDEACESGDCVGTPCEQTCGGECVSLDDPRHCGRCDNPVPFGAVCRDGAFACPDGTIDCDGRPDRLFCAAVMAGTGCAACNDGTGCAEGAYCIADACTNAPVTGLQVACGGPYAPGSMSVPCQALLVFDSATMLPKLDVTTSPFVTWTEGACTGPTCDPEGNGNDPELVEGPGTTPSAGLFTPAGRVDPTTVTAEVAQTVSARYTRGAIDVSASTMARTRP